MEFEPNRKIGRLVANKEEIKLAQIALGEMKWLEAGFFLRDLGLNFPITMNALKIAKKRIEDESGGSGDKIPQG